MTIFDFDDYKKFVSARIREMPAGGRGVLKKMAESMKVPRSTFSQVFQGSRDLTFEQAIDLAGYFELPALETDYFMALVEMSRAGNARLRAFTEKKLENLRQKSKTGRAATRSAIGEKAKAAYFSDWYYSAIHLACSLRGQTTVAEIASHLGLPLHRVKTVMDFLVQHGLCTVSGSTYRKAATLTLGPDDPLTFRHHQNWRLCAIRRMQEYPHLGDDELCITLPCSLDLAAMAEMRKLFSEAARKASQLTGGSEQLAFLNVDLLRINSKER